MRPSIVVATLCIAGLGAPSLLAATLEIPKRKPGYWEITTVAPVTGMTKIKVCGTRTEAGRTPDRGAKTRRCIGQRRSR